MEDERNQNHGHDEADRDEEGRGDRLGPQPHQAKLLFLDFGDEKLGTRLPDREQRREQVLQGDEQAFAAGFAAWSG